jgi:hypothetical protein
MFEESWRMFKLVVAVLGEIWNECVIGDAACLWEAVHAFAYFYLDMAMMD